MDKERRGTVCIINVYQVAGMSARDGTNVDRNRLTQLFDQLHFDVVAFNDEDGLTAAVSYDVLAC